MIYLNKAVFKNFDIWLELFSIGMVLILGTLWWLEFNYFVSEQKALARRSQPAKIIIVFGDSLTAGYGIGPANNYVAVLQRKIGQPIIIAAKSGRATAEALMALDKEVISRQPDIVIVMLGGNDFLQDTPKFALFNNLRQIILKIKQTGADAILVGIPAGFSDEYDRRFEELAAETSSIYIPNILKGILGAKEVLWDQFHPNVEGHKIMAERIHRALAPLFKK
ncbi:MAG: GDSL-type esterase/lipase family protein [bacterium]|nr:GDSL-type esterase/lipase family protein [bacterium]